MADRVIIRELINLIGVEVDPKAEESVNSFLGSIEKGVTRAGGFFFLLGELLEGVTAILDSTVGAFVRLVTTVADGADQMRLAAESTGVSTRSFQELAYAASTVGGDIGSVRAVLMELSKSARLAAEGNEQAGASFAKLGVSVRSSSGQLKAPDRLLRDVAEKLAALPPGAQRSALAFDVLGAQGVKLLPVLSKGSAGLAALAAEGAELGVVLSDEVVRASDDYMSELGKLEAAFQGLGNALAGPFLGVLTKLFTKLTDIVKTLTKLVGSRAVAFVDKLTRAMEASTKAGEAFHNVLLAIVGLILGRLLFALSALTGAQLAWGAAALIAGARAAAAGAIAAAAGALPLIPWLALGAAIVFIADEIISFFTGADSALKRFIKYLDSFNPTDHPLLELFKAIASLIFDITDTAKWGRLLTAMMGGIKWIWEKVVAIAKAIGRIIPDIKIGWGGIENEDASGRRTKVVGGFQPTRVGDVASAVGNEASRIVRQTKVTGFSVSDSRGMRTAARLGELSQQPAPMEATFGRGGSPTEAVSSARAAQAGTVFAPNFVLQQEVNALPGQSATEVGQAAAQSGEDLFNQELARTMAAFGNAR